MFCVPARLLCAGDLHAPAEPDVVEVGGASCLEGLGEREARALCRSRHIACDPKGFLAEIASSLTVLHEPLRQDVRSAGSLARHPRQSRERRRMGRARGGFGPCQLDERRGAHGAARILTTGEDDLSLAATAKRRSYRQCSSFDGEGGHASRPKVERGEIAAYRDCPSHSSLPQARQATPSRARAEHVRPGSRPRSGAPEVSGSGTSPHGRARSPRSPHHPSP